MSKIAHYLQEHLVGEVMTSPDARKYFATDGSIFTVMPAAVIYPKNENDVRKVTRFTWQLAERGRVVPITPRGAGTDLSGGALGAGLMMTFPAHMNRIVELDGKSGSVTVEPGINYGKLQETLHTHGRFLPPFPASMEYSTLGGAVANNASGEKSVKYGDTRDFVKSLRVVLANGEVIETKRLNKRDLSKKLGLSSFEGEIYRGIDALIEENQRLVETSRLPVTKNSAGYALAQVKRSDGSFDLTPLIVGSQGTLGVVTQITLQTESYNPSTTLVVAHFADVEQAAQAVIELRKLPIMPSAIEMVDDNLLNLVDKLNPNLLHGVLGKPFAKIILLIEFDESERSQKRMVKKAEKILGKFANSFQVEQNVEKQDQLWKIRHSSAVVAAHSEGAAKALPIIEDGVVPPTALKDYLEGVYELFGKYNLQAAVWGHAGDGNLHLQPYLDLGQVGARQKIFRLLDDYYALVIGLGGSTTGEHNDGRLRGAYLPKLYGAEIYALFAKTKQIFDPFGTLNPGVKIGVSLNDIKPLLRSGYSLDHLYQHRPHL